MAGRYEGLLLDPVYTSKAMAGLIDHVRRGLVPAGRNVVFLHTGGLPALFAYADSLALDEALEVRLNPGAGSPSAGLPCRAGFSGGRGEPEA